MGYYLEDHPNPYGPHFYTTRQRPLVGITVHCTAGLEDLDLIGIDHSAENTARYAATTSRVVSWHSGSDTDTVVELLPHHYTAFHVRGYNSSTYGHEISKRHMRWEGMAADWVTATLEKAAGHLGPMAKARGVPLRRINRAQLDKARAAGDPSQGGFIGHAPLDPTRRTDPGADFPWERFLDMAEGETMAFTETEEHELRSLVAELKALGSDMGFIRGLIPDMRKDLITRDELNAAISKITTPSGSVDSTARRRIEDLKEHLRKV